MRFFLRRLFVVAIGFAAATVAAAAPVTVEAILQTVKPPEVLTADFTLTKKTPAVAVTLTSRGRLVLSQTKGLLWMTTEPFEDCLGFSAVKRGELDEKGGWITSPSAYAGQAVDVVQKLLTAESDELRNLFFLSPSGTPDHWQLLASPKGGQLENVLTEILLTGNDVLQSVQISQTDGSLTRIYFSRVSRNPQLSPRDTERLEALQ